MFEFSQQSHRSNTAFPDHSELSFKMDSGLETAPYTLPTVRKSTTLIAEPDIKLDRQTALSADLEQYFQMDQTVTQTQHDRSSSHEIKSRRSGAKHKTSSDRDALTGLGTQQAIVAEQSNSTLGSSYNPVYGYGLVNAAKAVAWAAGYYPYAFPDVPDWGGSHWGNDRVKAQEAWNYEYTGQGVTVAVIDSGVDIFHPDLDDNIWHNSGEIAGDGIDNDRNGYVDDIFGWNFGNGQNNNVTPGTTDPGQSHGTHVAGTIAAEYNNFGTTGIAPDAKIMALRLADVQTGADGRGYFANAGNLAQAIRYAVDNGAKVINMSLSWGETPELIKALAYAADHNVITVSSSGNESQSAPGSPAKYATHFGISVGAIDYNNRVADFSNGAGYDSRMQYVVAPGVNIESTVPMDAGGYGVQSGTSMAAPHVAGVVALMLSANPNLTHAEIRYILTQSATA